MINTVKSSPTGTPRFARAISGASELTPPVADLAVEADWAGEEAPRVVVDSVHPEVLSRLRVAAVLARLPLRAHPAQWEVVGGLAVEEASVSVEAFHRSFSCAMAGN